MSKAPNSLHPNTSTDLYDKLGEVLGDELSDDGRDRLADLLGEERPVKKEVEVPKEPNIFDKIIGFFSKLDKKLFRSSRKTNTQFQKRDKGERWWT